jgi:hypothetical protein
MCISMIKKQETGFEVLENERFDNINQASSFEYDLEVDALSIDMDHSKYNVSIDIENYIIVDFDSANFPIGVEVLDVSRIFEIPKTALENIEFFRADVSISTELLKVKMILSTKYGDAVIGRIVTCEEINDEDIPASETTFIFISNKN